MQQVAPGSHQMAHYAFGSSLANLGVMLPGMISGFILAFTLSIDDFAVTIFTIGNEGLETLSTYIYADARKGGLTPELRPLSTLIFITVLVLLIVINKRAERARKN